MEYEPRLYYDRRKLGAKGDSPSIHVRVTHQDKETIKVIAKTRDITISKLLQPKITEIIEEFYEKARNESR